jgi:hypothetical protein
MRTRSCFWLRILPVVACACSACAFCQDPLDYVPNLPYTALVEQKYPEMLADGSRVRRQRKLVEMRDSQGRTRIEHFPPEDVNCCRGDDRPDVVDLYFPLQRQFIQLFPGRKTASVFTFPGTGPIPRHFDPNGKNAKRENLPGKTIEGIFSEGTRVTYGPAHGDGRTAKAGCVEETWVSPEMKIAVRTKYSGTCSDGGITEIRELDRNEPDATLFEIPKDYKAVTAKEGQPEDRLLTLANPKNQF